MANSNGFNVELLTESNRKHLLETIDLALEEYAFATKNIVHISADNLEELDKLLKFIKIGEKLGIVEHLLGGSEGSKYPIMYFLRVEHSKLLELKNSLEGAGNTARKTMQGRTAKLSLNTATKTIRLSYGGDTKNVHKFRSKLDANYVIFKNLTLYPNRAMTKKDMGVPTMLSALKDIPKTMGFTGELKGIFFTIDTKNKTLALHPQKTLTDDEVEILNHYVNSKKDTK